MAGRIDGIRIVQLADDQRIYSQEVEPSPGDTEVLLLDRQRIYVPPEIVLDVTVPDPKDPVVVTARRKQARGTAGAVVGVTVALGAFVAGAAICPECFLFAGL